MIAVNHKLSISRQARLLGMSLGSIYYVPRLVSLADLALMRRMDELHLDYPFMGARQLRNTLVREDYQTGRAHISTLMKRMGMEALYRKLDTSRRHPGHQIYPYLLRKLDIRHANQVRALDTTYIPMARGFVYLTAVLSSTPTRVASLPRWTSCRQSKNKDAN
jgi:putative transposase